VKALINRSSSWPRSLVSSLVIPVFLLSRSITPNQSVVMSRSAPATSCVRASVNRREEDWGLLDDRGASFSDIIHVLNRDPSIESLRQLPTEEKLEFACRATATTPLPASPRHTYYLLQVLTLLRGTEPSKPGEQDMIASTLTECIGNLAQAFESVNRYDLCEEMHSMFKTRRLSISPLVATVTVGALLASILLYRSV
jgi:hypothetical protein